MCMYVRNERHRPVGIYLIKNKTDWLSEFYILLVNYQLLDHANLI